MTSFAVAGAVVCAMFAVATLATLTHQAKNNDFLWSLQGAMYFVFWTLASIFCISRLMEAAL